MRRRRVAGGYSGVELAARAGISIGFLSELETGKRNPSPATLTALAKALDCQVEDIMARPTLAPMPAEIAS